MDWTWALKQIVPIASTHLPFLKAVLPYEPSLSVEHTKQVTSRNESEIGFEHTSARDASDLGMSTGTAMVTG